MPRSGSRETACRRGGRDRFAERPRRAVRVVLIGGRYIGRDSWSSVIVPESRFSASDANHGSGSAAKACRPASMAAIEAVQRPPNGLPERVTVVGSHPHDPAHELERLLIEVGRRVPSGVVHARRRPTAVTPIAFPDH